MPTTLREWIDQVATGADARYICAWRKRAIRTMRPVVEQFLIQRENGVEVSATDLLAGIESARREADIPSDTKRWKQEHAELLAIVQRTPDLWPAPTIDDRGACDVATDLLAMAADLDRVNEPVKAKLKRDEALELLIKQAPNRYSRRCKVCGAKPGDPCLELVTRAEMLIPHEMRLIV